MPVSVLVVEDHAELRSEVQQMLMLRRYDVRCAGSVEEAVVLLRDMPTPCIVLWDPVTLQLNANLIAHTLRRGVHIATIPVSVNSTGQAADGSPIVAKRLTNLDAVLGIVRQHCPETEDLPPV